MDSLMKMNFIHILGYWRAKLLVFLIGGFLRESDFLVCEVKSHLLYNPPYTHFLPSSQHNYHSLLSQYSVSVFSWLNMVQSQACARILFPQQFVFVFSAVSCCVGVCVRPPASDRAPDPSPGSLWPLPASGLPSRWADAGRAAGSQGPLPSTASLGAGRRVLPLLSAGTRGNIQFGKSWFWLGNFLESCRGFWRLSTKEDLWALSDCVILLVFFFLHPSFIFQKHDVFHFL